LSFRPSGEILLCTFEKISHFVRNDKRKNHFPNIEPSFFEKQGRVYCEPPMSHRLKRKTKSDIKVVGLISDTHGLVRPQALAALQGVDLIVHSGDIGKPEVLELLKGIAPLVAIKGNIDRDNWARRLPETKTLRVGGIRMFVIHNVNELDFNPAARRYNVVVSGHSHMPSVVTRDSVLFVNPGSAGPRRFKLPVALGKLRVAAGKVTAELIELSV
jgi:putative phosphoesterase